MKKVLSGNELIVEGGLEAGFSLYTGYPGSPLADYFNILYSRNKELELKGIRVAIANSEANAAAMASGAKQANRHCLVAMKSMGLHVASDALSVGNFANPGKGAVVVVVGDDPWSISTSTPADSRFLFKHLHIPFLEPSSPQELKDWIACAMELSKESSLYCGILLTTYMAEGGGRVETYDYQKVDAELLDIDISGFDLSKSVMVPPNSLNADIDMVKERFPKFITQLSDLKLDIVDGNDNSNLGFIISGAAYSTSRQVLEDRGLLKLYSIYKVASSYPLVENNLLLWLKDKEFIVVIEEKRGFLESQLTEVLAKNAISIKLMGKKLVDGSEGFPAYGGLSYEIINQKISKILNLLKLDNGRKEIKSIHSWDLPLPARLPTFCPGCPHRETLSLLKDIRKTLLKEEIDLISHGDVGCYSLSFLPPFREMHNLSAMGQGGSLGAGMDIFSKNPSVVLMGDSTFFHSGLTNISNSVQLDHNITYIILDNDNTAMTGHQMTPVSGVSVEGKARPRQDIMSIVKGLGVSVVKEVNPSDRYFYKSLLSSYIKRDGVKVIISNKECALTYHGRLKAKQREMFVQGKSIESKSFYQINTSVCEDCRECVEMTGCPGLTRIEDAYGSKVNIDPQICVSDGYCTKLKACPSFELVEVANYHPSLHNNKNLSLIDGNNIPLPKIKKSFDHISLGVDWRLVVTGVGGSGVTTISRVIAEAAKEMGDRSDLSFKFLDQKGLAQRNGNVTSHLCIYSNKLTRGPVTPMASADLVLSPDLLDGSRHVGFVSNEGLIILDKKFQSPLTIMLDYESKREAIKESTLMQKMKAKLHEKVIFRSFKDLSYYYFGKNIYASSMILGTAFQSGYLPFTIDNIKRAFEKVIVKDEFLNNWQAFNMGRRIFLEGDDNFISSFENSVDIVQLLKDSIRESFLFSRNKKIFLKMYDRQLSKLIDYFPFIKSEYLAQYLHDIYIYDRGLYVEDFIKQAGMLKLLYQEKRELELSLRILAKTYFIKDEIMVAHIMVSPMQRKINTKNYKKLGTRYKITHINRPSFDIMGKKFEFDINPKDWMLKVMRHLRFLRKILFSWHKKEREIAFDIRTKLLEEIPKLDVQSYYSELKKLDNIKGYREIRYRNYHKAFNK